VEVVTLSVPRLGIHRLRLRYSDQSVMQDSRIIFGANSITTHRVGVTDPETLLWILLYVYRYVQA
jgi:hypothetical protein